MSEAAATQSPWQMAKIIRIEKRTPRVTSFFFKLSRPFAHQAGQYVDVRLTTPDGYQARRSYSIASAPESGGTVELAIERLEDGEVSPFFHEVAAVGDEIELRGPLGGHFVWSDSDGGPIILVGGGSGVVPLMAMVRHRAARKSSVPVALVFSARIWDEVIFRDELIKLDDRRDGFDLVLTLTREPAQRPDDYSRRIDAQMIHVAAARAAEARHRLRLERLRLGRRPSADRRRRPSRPHPHRALRGVSGLSIRLRSRAPTAASSSQARIKPSSIS